jgi:hypothetical protein
MAKVVPIQTNFTAGELSPRVHSRVDIAKYNNGLKTCENVQLLVHGGARRRPGLRYVQEAKSNTQRARLIGFVYDRDQAYMLEFGNLYMRVFKDGAWNGTEVVTPYTSAMLPELNYTQNTDTMFLAHPQVPVQRLQRFGDTSWVMLAAPFTVEPFEELGTKPAVSLTLSAATVGAGRNFGAPGAFLSGDVGRVIYSTAGAATITAFIDANNVTATITSAFAGTAIASGAWTLNGTPQASVKPSAKDPVGANITLTSDASVTTEAAKNITGISHNGTDTVNITIPAHGYASGNSVQIAGITPAAYNGTQAITVINTNTVTYNLTPDPGPATVLGTATRIVSPTALNIWRAEDVGKFVKINGGLVKITAITSGLIANGQIMQALNSVVSAIPNSWTLNRSIWGGSNGYPRAVTLHEQRLFLAGAPGSPQTLSATSIGNYLNFELGTKDDDAFSYELSTSQAAFIQHLAQNKRLMVFTSSNEMSVRGGVERPITATNIQKSDESTAGANSVRPVKVGSEIIFVQRAGRKVRACGFVYNIDGFDSPDRSVFSEHITVSGITETAYQQEPESTLYCVRGDGQLLAVSYDIGQEVNGWARWITDGTVESVASIPTTNSEQTWVIVRRVINGVEKRFIEYFDPVLKLDAAITASSVPGATVWAGLVHLEGKTVKAVADNVYMGEFTVTGGSITLQRKAFAVQIGLPYTPKLVLLNPEVGSQAGTSQGAAISVAEVIVRVLDTVSCYINGEVQTFRKIGNNLLDRAPEVGTGGLRQTKLSEELYSNELEITQPNPVDFHVLAVIRKCTIND